MNETGASGAPGSPVAPSSPGWTWERLVLLVLVIAFIAISFWAGTVAYYNLQSYNSTDLGIFLQAFSSTVHGHPAPFYESYDCLVKSRCSFLLVHPSPILYPMVPFFYLEPSALTLFLLQSIGVGAAALPLYGLTREVTGSRTKALVAAGLYLVWAPTLGGEAFSFHLESFLPLTLLTVAYFWQVRRYRLGLLAALVAFVTLEIAPVFTFLIGVFFLVPFVESAFRLWWSRRRAKLKTSVRASLGFWWARLRSTFLRTEIRYTIALLVISVAAYFVLYLFMNVFGARLLGVPSPPIGPGISGVLTNNSTPGIMPLSQVLSSAQTGVSIEYWLILFALAGFLPFLAPRTLVVAVPWVGWTLLTNTSRFTTIGHQYSLVAAGPIFFGVAYGLTRVPLDREIPTPPEGAGGPPPPALGARRRRSGSPVRTFSLLVVAVLIFANALLLPIDPALADAGVVLGAPFVSGYQNHPLTIIPGFNDVEQLLSLVPETAVVVAPSTVFPLLAGRPNAAVLDPSLRNQNFPALPINATDDPSYVVLYPNFLPLWRGSLKTNVSDPATYGVRGYLASSTLGPLLVYELDYTASVAVVGPAFPPANWTLSPRDGLSPGPVSSLRANASAPYGEVIGTLPSAGRAGGVWNGPDELLSPGNYLVSAEVSVTPPNASFEHKGTILRIEVEGYGWASENYTYAWSAFEPGNWTNLSFAISVPAPIPEFEVNGYLNDGQVGLSVAAVRIVPFDPP